MRPGHKNEVIAVRVTKQQRQMLIREILLSNRVASQEELNARLRGAGVRVTQSTLSRDLREMRIARQPEDEGMQYVLPEHAKGRKLRRVVQEEIVQIGANEATILIKTLPGRAAGVGVFIDHLDSPDILGTVAGNDTLLVIPKTVRKTGEVLKLLRALYSETQQTQ